MKVTWIAILVVATVMIWIFFLPEHAVPTQGLVEPPPFKIDTGPVGRNWSPADNRNGATVVDGKPLSLEAAKIRPIPVPEAVREGAPKSSDLGSSTFLNNETLSPTYIATVDRYGNDSVEIPGSAELNIPSTAIRVVRSHAGTLSARAAHIGSTHSQ